MEDMGLTELLFRRTEVQSNVFSSAMIPNFDVVDDVSPDERSVESLLVACLKPVPPGEMDRQRIMIHSCLSDVSSIRPVSKPLHSNALSPEAEVVAIKAEFCTINGDTSFLMLAFAYVKRKGEAGLCIHRLPSSDMRDLTRHQGRLRGKVILPLESATSMPLHSLPWQIISAKFSDQGELKLALLVSHVFTKGPVEERRPLSAFVLRKNGDFVSIPNYDHFFPELRQCEEQIFYMESVFLEERMMRLTAWGSDTGTFEVACVGLTYDNVLAKRYFFTHSTPITSLRFFPEFVLPRLRSPFEESPVVDAPTIPLHLLVSSAAEPTVIYTDPIGKGVTLSNQIILAESADFDCVLCTCLIDLDLDGIDEIVLGTYSGHLLAYKQSTSSASREYKMISRQKVGGPVLAIHVGDMTGDGVKEIAVVTTRGVHIMQYPLNSVMDHLVEVLSNEVLD